MDEQDIARQLKILKTVKPRDVWAFSARQMLLQNMHSREEVQDMGNIGLSVLSLFRVPRWAFAAVPAFVLVIALSLSLALQNGTSDDADNVAVSEVPTEDLLHGKEAVARPAAQFDVAQIARNDTGDTANNGSVVQSPSKTSTATYLQVYSEDLDVALRASLNERINRITVLAQEGESVYAQRLAAKAQNLFDAGDYDAAIRVIILAEDILE